MSETPAIVPLSSERHGGKGWNRFQSYQFAGKQALASLSAPEIARAALDLPLGFVKQEKGLRLVAVLGLGPDRNLFVAPDGRWHGGYVPASLRSYPFRMGRNESSDQMILCIDETSDLITEEGGEPFFDGAGALSKPMGEVWNFMQEVAKGETQLDAACARLAEFDIVEPWPLQIKDGETEKKVEGLFRISEEKLNGLEDESFNAFRRAGLLALSYAQMLSAGNISKLGELARAHARHAEAAAQKREAEANARTTAPSQNFAPSESLDIDWSKIG